MGGLPYDLSVYWQQYPWIFGEDLCKLRALVSEMTSYTSVLTIVAFSTERYLAICHPLYSYAMSGLKRAVRIITALWVIGFVSAMPFAVYTTVHYVDYPPDSGKLLSESAFCAMLEDDLPPNCPIYELSFLLFFLIPMLIIIGLYIYIGLRLRKRSRHSLGRRVEGEIHDESKYMKTRKAIIRMLAAVVVAFFLCWAPFHAQRLVYLYANRSAPYYPKINEWLYYIAGCFYYFSSTINPILYNLMSVKYRSAFRQTLCGYRYKRNRSKYFNSSFRNTIVQKNDSSNWKRSLTWKQASEKLLNSNGTDLVVMIAPCNDGESSQRASFNWRKTFLCVSLCSKLTTNSSSGDCPNVRDKNKILNKRNSINIQEETCI
ncbi:hypothetical protein PGB90_008287 [Kerria lacca]